MASVIQQEFAQLWVAIDSAFDASKNEKGEKVLAVRNELAKLIEGVTVLRNHFDVDRFDADKSMKDFPAVARIRQKKGTAAEKTSANPFL